MELTGKTAVITGGAVRIGKAITLALAKAGCNVFIHYGRSSIDAEITKIEAEGCGIKAVTYSADLGSEAETDSIIPEALSHFASIDILINSAAIFPDNDTFNDINSETRNNIFAVNFHAALLLSKGFANQGWNSKSGKIINIVDARIFRHESDHLGYCLSKKCLWELTTILALELAPSITVNALAPGAILPPPGKDETYLKRISSNRIPLMKNGNVDDVTRGILYLLENDFITGETIKIDGGEYL